MQICWGWHTYTENRELFEDKLNKPEPQLTTKPATSLRNELDIEHVQFSRKSMNVYADVVQWFWNISETLQKCLFQVWRFQDRQTLKGGTEGMHSVT